MPPPLPITLWLYNYIAVKNPSKSISSHKLLDSFSLTFFARRSEKSFLYISWDFSKVFLLFTQALFCYHLLAMSIYSFSIKLFQLAYCRREKFFQEKKKKNYWFMMLHQDREEVSLSPLIFYVTKSFLEGPKKWFQVGAKFGLCFVLWEQ